MPVIDRIQIRRGIATDWTSTNPILASGEFGFESDTNRLKVGDGTAAWISLPYISSGGGGGGAVDSVNGQVGVVVLDTGDIAESGSLYFTNERAQDAVGAAFDSTLVYNDGTNAMGRAAITGAVTISAGSNTASLSSAIQADIDSKQDLLVSGTNIKTLNGGSLLGSGDIIVGGSSNIDGGSSSSVYTTGTGINGGNA